MFVAELLSSLAFKSAEQEHQPGLCLFTSLLGIWSFALLQLRTGAGLPLAAHRSDTVVPFFTTICPFDGCVVIEGGTETERQGSKFKIMNMFPLTMIVRY